MTVRLEVRREAWLDHVRRTAAEIGAVVPVVKGNGYGFGRAVLHPVAAELSTRVAVGTVHELDHVAADVTPVVLTPSLRAPTPLEHGDEPVLTVGSCEHVAALGAWRGRVVVKLRSSMQRYGVEPDDLDALLHAVERSELVIDGTALHLPLAGEDGDRLDEIERWLSRISPSWPMSVSHLTPPSFAELRERHPERMFELRAGTSLWHGDKSFLHLGATVLDVHPAPSAPVAGYRAQPVDGDATIVLIGAGSAHGIAPLADGSSPFHFARRRLALLEPPHMHTSMAIVPPGQPCPRLGDVVDVQRPLTTTLVDTIDWLP